MKNIITIKWTEPKVKSVNTHPEGGYTFVLDWGIMGLGIHRVYKKDNQYVWTDKQSPVPVRKFDSIQRLMWEYELPKSLETYLKKL